MTHSSARVTVPAKPLWKDVLSIETWSCESVAREEDLDMSDMNYEVQKASESLSTETPADVPVIAPQWPALVASEPSPMSQATPVSQPVAARAPSRVVGKTRHPWRVWLLSFPTLGIYPLVWYFKINKELRDYSETIDIQPGMAVVAITLGAILIGIPPLVSFVHTTSRIQKAQKLSGSPKRCSAILAILCLMFGMVYIQSQLNKVWDQYGNPPLGTPLQA